MKTWSKSIESLVIIAISSAIGNQDTAKLLEEYLTIYTLLLIIFYKVLMSYLKCLICAPYDLIFASWRKLDGIAL